MLWQLPIIHENFPTSMFNSNAIAYISSSMFIDNKFCLRSGNILISQKRNSRFSNIFSQTIPMSRTFQSLLLLPNQKNLTFLFQKY